MRAAWAIVKRELRSYLVSPVSYTAIMVFLLIQGGLFILSLRSYQSMMLRATVDPRIEVPTAGVLVQTMLGTDIIWSLLIIVPLVTMQLLAGEKQRHTAELLLTAPITTRQIVAGKFAGALVMLAVMLTLTGWMVGVLRVWGDADPAPILVGYLGAFLFGAFTLALGLLASSLTESPFQSALLALVLLVVAYAAGSLAPMVPYIGQDLEQFTPTANVGRLSRGVIDSQALVYFLSLTYLVLDLTARVLDSQRWR